MLEFVRSEGSGVYIIMNRGNNKVYVGSSVNILQRCRQHRSYLKRGVHKNRHLQAAWNKYGEDCFHFGILQTVADESELLSVEQYWMDCFDVCNRECGYNAHPVAGRTTGVKRSDEFRAKSSAARMGKPVHDDEARAKISEALLKFYEENPHAREQRGDSFRGRTHTDEAKEKVAAAKRGKKRPEFSEEWRKNMSESHKGLKRTPEQCAAISERMKETWRLRKEAKQKEQECATQILEAA